MQPLPITCLLVIALAAAMIALSIATIRQRRSAGVSVGDGGNEPLTRVMRAQSNLFENSVVFVALIGLLENGAMGSGILVIIAALFVLGRAMHAYGMLVAEPRTDRQGRFRWRAAGMGITFTLIAVAALLLLGMLILEQVIVF